MSKGAVDTLHHINLITAVYAGALLCTGARLWLDATAHVPLLEFILDGDQNKLSLIRIGVPVGGGLFFLLAIFLVIALESRCRTRRVLLIVYLLLFLVTLAGEAFVLATKLVPFLIKFYKKGGIKDKAIEVHGKIDAALKKLSAEDSWIANAVVETAKTVASVGSNLVKWVFGHKPKVTQVADKITKMVNSDYHKTPGIIRRQLQEAMDDLPWNVHIFTGLLLLLLLLQLWALVLAIIIICTRCPKKGRSNETETASGFGGAWGDGDGGDFECQGDQASPARKKHLSFTWSFTHSVAFKPQDMENRYRHKSGQKRSS